MAAQPRQTAAQPSRIPAILTISVIGEEGAARRGRGRGTPGGAIEAIGLVRCKPSAPDGTIEVVECRAAGQEGMDEAELLSRLWQGIDGYKPLVVSFGGSGGGLSLLRHRSMMYGLTARHLGGPGGPLGASPSSGGGIHLDLAAALSLDGTPLGMDDLCQLIRTNADLQAGTPRRRAAIAAALVFTGYLRFLMFTGSIDPERHNAGVASLDEALRRSPDIAGQ